MNHRSGSQDRAAASCSVDRAYGRTDKHQALRLTRAEGSADGDRRAVVPEVVSAVVDPHRRREESPCPGDGSDDVGPSPRAEEGSVVPVGRIAAVGTVLTASALLLPGAAASADPGKHRGGHGHQTTMQFDVEFSPHNYVDVGEPGPSAGDVIVFHDQLLRGGRQFGEMAGSCVVIETTPLANCTAVVRLSEQDTITFAFLNAPPPEKVFAITGGSGTYSTAHGDGLLIEHGDGTGELTLTDVRK
jgi:hypothetical protein